MIFRQLFLLLDKNRLQPSSIFKKLVSSIKYDTILDKNKLKMVIIIQIVILSAVYERFK
jgi:hypothetical protein